MPPATRSDQAPRGLIHFLSLRDGPARPRSSLTPAVVPADQGSGMVLTPLPPLWRVPVRPVSQPAQVSAEGGEASREALNVVEPAGLDSPTAELSEGEAPTGQVLDDVGTTQTLARSTHQEELPAPQSAKLTDVESVTHDSEAEPIEERSPAADRRERSRATLARSRRLGLGPAYHGPLPEAVSAEHDRAERDLTEKVDPTAGATGVGEPPSEKVEKVPDDVRTIMRAATGVDIDAVHRGSKVSKEATRLGAIAFAREGAVFVPDEVGPLDRPPGRAVVAHEVAHAAQQRTAKPALPGENTPAGAALEAEAQLAERYFRGDPDAPRPGASREAESGGDDDDGDDGIEEAHALMRRLVSEGFAVSDGSGGIVFDGSTGSEPGVQRQTAPAPPRPASAGERDWNPFETLAHQVYQEATTFSGDLVTSEFGVDVHNEVADSLNTSEREFASGQYRHLRLIHRKTAFAAEHAHAALTPDDETRLAQEVDRDVQARLDELERRVDRRVQALNTSGAGQAAAVLPAEQYRQLVHHLFGDATADAMAPDDTSDIRPRRGVARSVPGAPGAGVPGAAGAGVPGAAGAGVPGTAGAGVGGGPGSAATSQTGSAHTGAAPGATASRTPTSALPGSASARKGASQGSQPAESEAANPEGIGIGRRLKQLAGTSGTELVGLYTDELGVQLSQDEWQQVRRDLGANAPAGGGATVAGAAAGAQERATGSPTAESGGDAGAQSSRHGTRQVGPASAGESTIGPGGHEHLDLDHLDLDDLSERIYGRMRRLLRMELLVDRERAGLLTDFR
jgi:Domain of unknown function (DUF4157)